jgi:outer membrane protein TolC
MTSLATALGALPIAMALGASSQSRIPMGITIIGGLIFSLVLTLYVIPALYTYLTRSVKNHNTRKMKPFRVDTVTRKTLLVSLVMLCGHNLAGQQILTLQDAIRIGLENNYSLVIQNNAITTTHQETFSGSVKDISGAKNHTFNTGIQLTWTIFDGFSMFVSKDLLNILEEMGETELRLAVENLLSLIILNYYGIIQQQKLILVLEDAAALSLERKKIMEAKISLGAGSELMLLQSTVDLNTDSINLIREKASVQHTMADLNRLLARDPETRFLASDSIVLSEALTYDSLRMKALQQNNAILLARKNVSLNTLALKDTKSQRYPQLNFNAGYNYNQLNSQTGFLEYNRSLGPSFGLSLSYPLFDGFNLNREVKNARIELNTMEYYLKDTDLGIQTDLFKLYIDYLTNLRIANIETLNQEVARENVDVAFEKYRLGSINDIELRETQKKYIDAQYQLLLSQFQAKKAEIELLKISGELERVLSSKL